jgi:hypothetical protein
MSSETPTIPEGWERVPSDQLIVAGDMYWHPWYRKWKDHDSSHKQYKARDYEIEGATVIRKKETT